MQVLQDGLDIYDGDGANADFAYNFRILTSAEILVYLHTGTTWQLRTLTTDYTLSGVGNASGGTVTFVTAPASGTANVVLVRATALTQLAQFTTGAPFPAATLEEALDKLTMICQDLDTIRILATGAGGLGFVEQASASVTETATTHAVTFATARVDADFMVQVETNWATTVHITAKATTGFTINFGTAAPASAVAYWRTTA